MSTIVDFKKSLIKIKKIAKISDLMKIRVEIMKEYDKLTFSRWQSQLYFLPKLDINLKATHDTNHKIKK